MRPEVFEDVFGTEMEVIDHGGLKAALNCQV